MFILDRVELLIIIIIINIIIIIIIIIIKYSDFLLVIRNKNPQNSDLFPSEFLFEQLKLI